MEKVYSKCGSKCGMWLKKEGRQWGSGKENLVNKGGGSAKSCFYLVFPWSNEEGNKLKNKELFIQQSFKLQ